MKKKHPEHVNHERWLVSYADFITLLFAFFVVLFASGQSDKRKQMQLAHSMQAAFDHNGIFDPHSKTPAIVEDPNAIRGAVASPLTLPVPSLEVPAQNPQDNGAQAKAAADHVREVVKEQVAKNSSSDNIISVHASPDGLVVSLREAGFFASGSAEVRIESLELLKTVAASLPDQEIRVEGHTDDVPIHTAQFATNWELSTARAATITRLLIAQHTVEPSKIAAAGYAEFHPIASNATEEGRARNRRVDIVLLTKPKPTPEEKPAASATSTKTP